MTHIVVRGLAMAGTLVTAGLGPTDGDTTQQALSGTISPFGTLGVTYQQGTGLKDKHVSGAVSIDIDVGVD